MDPSRIPTNNIPVFDGTNYIPWSRAMRGVFRWAGSWEIVHGTGVPSTPIPRPSPGTDAVSIAARAAWDEKNYKALGLMEIYISLVYSSYIGDRETAAEVWTVMKDAFGTPGAVGAFVAF